MLCALDARAWERMGDFEEGEWSLQTEVATSPELHAIKNLKQIAREEFINVSGSPGHGAHGVSRR